MFVRPRVGQLRGLLCIVTSIHPIPPRRYEVTAVVPPYNAFTDAFKPSYYYMQHNLDMVWNEAEVV